MAVFRVPLPEKGTPILSQRTTLDGVSYRIDFLYNARVSRWYFSLFDSDDAAIVRTRPMVTFWPLLTAVSKPTRPPGELLLTTPDGVDPSLETIDAARLYYFDASERE